MPAPLEFSFSHARTFCGLGLEVVAASSPPLVIFLPPLIKFYSVVASSPIRQLAVTIHYVFTFSNPDNQSPSAVEDLLQRAYL